MGNNPPNSPSRRTAGEPESLGRLISDCHRMADRWPALPPRRTTAPGAAALHGVTVPAASAHAVAGMTDYGA